MMLLNSEALKVQWVGRNRDCNNSMVGFCLTLSNFIKEHPETLNEEFSDEEIFQAEEKNGIIAGKYGYELDKILFR